MQDVCVLTVFSGCGGCVCFDYFQGVDDVFVLVVFSECGGCMCFTGCGGCV